MNSYRTDLAYGEGLVDQNEDSWERYRRRSFSRETPKKHGIDTRLLVVLCIFLIGLSIVLVLFWSNDALGLFGESDAGNQSTPQSEWQQGVMPNLYQTDEQWSDHPYAESSFGESGCGPICLTAVYIYLTGDRSVSPTDISDMAQNAGYASSDGTAWEFMTVGASMLGIHAEETLLDESTVRDHLDAGNPIICIMGEGDFTTTGHFIVISRMTAEGLLVVHDSNSVERSSRLWSLETIQEQYRNAWVYW